ncbi:MAG: hypothetical protein RMK15_03730 [Chloroflexota bacterium]|jgi:hypothetical protein|nr:hypothetical protein [Dehalococcoidia bacterium]MDW8046374.1 hypothetical protein [Chloroflexota bacterium]
MGIPRPALVIFHGGLGTGEAERLMADARAAAARNTARTALAAGFEAVILATDEPEAFPDDLPRVYVDPDSRHPGPFDFAARLKEIVSRYGLEKPAVMGSGSVPLLGLEEFQLIVEQLEQRDRRFVTNNFFSADLTAWTPGEAIFEVGAFTRDNALPRRLRDDAGLAPVVLPRTTATQFDLDTPTDLAILALDDTAPPELARAAAPLAERCGPLRELMRLLCDRTAEIVVSGRVGSQAWQYLERETACRVRLFSEERGLAAAGPEHRARSLLGYLVEEVGVRRFFALMATLGDAFVCDTRVLEAHLGLHPSREDRFQSDLLAWDRIEEPWLREFTRAAAEAAFPVVLGGHSLVSGGLMALNDVAWREHDRRLGLA